MYWWQIGVGLASAGATAYYLLERGIGVAVSILIAILAYVLVRWGITWVYRTQYWYKLGRHVSTSHCPSCGQSIKRLGGDWFLECKRCNWREGWPITRWLTRSVPARQLRRTIIGPKLLLAILVLLILPLVINGVGLTTNNLPSSGDDPGNHDGFNETKTENQILEYVNKKRSQRGMPNLSYNTQAAKAANRHAEDMAANNYFNHTSQSGETQLERYSFCNGGENAAQTWVNRRLKKSDGETVVHRTERDLASGIVKGWMNSDPHRERGIFGERWVSAGAGIGITEDGKVYAVLGFCRN